MFCFLVQTEKSYQLQQKNTFTLAFADKNFRTNKIELTKLLKKLGLTALLINSTKSYQKQKRRSNQKSIVSRFRPKKFFITLDKGQNLTEDLVEKLNQDFLSKKVNNQLV